MRSRELQPANRKGGQAEQRASKPSIEALSKKENKALPVAEASSKSEATQALENTVPKFALVEFVQTLETSIERCTQNIVTAKRDLDNISNKVNQMSLEMKAALDTTARLKNLCQTTDNVSETAIDIGAKIAAGKRNLEKQNVIQMKPLSAEAEAIRKTKLLPLPPINKHNPAARSAKSSESDYPGENVAGNSKLSQIKKIAKKRTKDQVLKLANKPETQSLYSFEGDELNATGNFKPTDKDDLAPDKADRNTVNKTGNVSSGSAKDDDQRHKGKRVLICPKTIPETKVTENKTNKKVNQDIKGQRTRQSKRTQ